MMRLPGHRLVGCVVPKGVGQALLGRLFRELGVSRAELHSARGFLGSDPRGLFNRVEKDYLMAVVEDDRADEVFDWIYREADVAGSEGRFVYMTPPVTATLYEIPGDLPLEH